VGNAHQMKTRTRRSKVREGVPDELIILVPANGYILEAHWGTPL
jgi:hypothetical protein